MTYRGNANLKLPGEDIEWTPELIEEFVKCSEDPAYFCKYIKIVHVDHGLIDFIPRNYQEEMLQSMTENRRSAFVCSRQSGKSICVGAWILWYIIFNEHKQVGILANKNDTAVEILGRIQLAYQYLPRWLQHGVLEFNKSSFVLENGCKVLAAATSSDNIRGKTMNVIYLDECAFIEGFAAFSASVLPTISSGETTKIIMTSTPNGLNHFYKTVTLGEKPKDDPEYNGYYIIRVPWDMVPGRDEKWRQQVMRDLDFDEEKFEQEYNIQFLGSSGTLIAGWKLKELVMKVPIVQTEGRLFQYEKPVEGHRYVVIVDTSHGKGLDYSAFHVIDVSYMPYKQVCTFYDNTIVPMDYAEYVHKTAVLYNEAFILCEINEVGEQIGNALWMDFEYPNLLLTENSGRAGKKLTAGFGSKRSDRGVRTTPIVKSQGCSFLKLLVEGNQLIINNEETIYELSRFSRKGKSYEAEEGCHDDLVMGLVLFAWMTNQPLFKELTSINTMAKIRESDEVRIEAEMSPFGFVTDGREDIPEIIDDYENSIQLYNF